jgi:hypothetical protein
MYSRLPEDEPSVLNHVGDKKNKNKNINLENIDFVGLYCTVMLKCEGLKT